MAKLLSSQILTPSKTLLSPYTSTIHSKPSSSFPISINPSSNFRLSVNTHGRGPTTVARASSTAVVPDNIYDVLGEVNIFTATGQPVKFSELWDQKEGVAVVALLRHFGCFCSWELAESLKESKERFDAAGVKLITVGVGTPDKAQLLAERLPFPLDSLYADPERKAYDVLGLYYGFGRTFLNPASVKVFQKSRFNGLKKAMKNYTIKVIPDDSSVLQQGGMFVFKGTQLLYARKDEGSGDHAPLDDIFDICCKVPAVILSKEEG